ncbi:VQ motif-containing protein 22-like [Lotus japonicus]|uniref:VQ motif-containing protein 22-like n=1 Tax=Lotus japonicus TaxID=34305 RepID=UPI0025907D7E|nr:VQ motif-containing protein 22-like [Lotus japonicus]
MSSECDPHPHNMSGSTSKDWLHFYQESSSFPTAGQVSVSEATTVTTTTPTQLNPDGRVSKPIRRRSRASRRTPTTLLNTDTTNFRAMVQQFTGGPTAPFAQAVGLGFASRPPRGPLPSVNTNGLVLEHQQLYHQQQNNQQQYMFGGGNREAAVAENTFFQRLSNPITTTNTITNLNVNDEDQLFMDHGGRFFPTT